MSGDRGGSGQKQGGIWSPEAQAVPLGQLTALEAAHLVLQRCGPAAHHLRDIQPAGKGDVGPAAGFGGPQRQPVPRLDGYRLIHGTGPAVEDGGHVRPGDGDHIVLVKAQRGTQHGGLQGALPLRVAHQQVGGAECRSIHRPRRRHAELLIAVPALVLNGGEDAGIFCHKAHGQTPLSQVLHWYSPSSTCRLISMNSALSTGTWRIHWPALSRKGFSFR